MPVITIPTFDTLLTDGDFADAADAFDGYGGANFLDNVKQVADAMTNDSGDLLLEYTTDVDGIIGGANLMHCILVNGTLTWVAQYLDFRDLTTDDEATGVDGYRAIHEALTQAVHRLDRTLTTLLTTPGVTLLHRA